MRRLVVALGVVALTLPLGQTTVEAEQPVAPPVPTAVEVSPRADKAVASWQGNGATSWLVEVAEQYPFVSPRQIPSTSTIAVVTNLTPATTYYARVRALSGDGEYSQPSVTVMFTTARAGYPAPAPVVELTSETSTSVSASWQEVSPASAYEVEITDTVTGNTVKTATTEKLTKTVSDLKADTGYAARVRAVDGSGDPLSDWSLPATAETVGDLPLKVASYNIKCANCSGGASWSKRRTAVANTILGQMPDVLGLQEASQGRMKGRGTSQFMDLLGMLGSPYKVTNSSPGASGAVRIFYNSDTVELVDQGARKLPRSGGNQQRYLSWAIFKQKKTGKEFLFGDTHLEPGKKFGNLRRRQATTIVSTLKAVADGRPTIVVGDLNSYRWMKGGNKPYDVLVQAGYKDPLGMTFKSRGQSAPGAFVENRINTRFSSYNDYKRKAPRLSHINGTYLDYILVTPMRVSEWETVVKVNSSGRFIGTIPSDHNLVRATVWLP